MSTSRPPDATSDDDVLVLLLIGVTVGPGLLVLAWAEVVDWLIAHQVLVPASRQPLLVLPASGDAGLDLPRLLLLAAVLLVVLAVLGHQLRRVLRRRTDVGGER